MTLLTLNSSAQDAESKKPVSGDAAKHDYSVKIVRFADLEAVMKKNDDKLYVVNFWATWCPYCRHEMPDMERFYRDFRAQGFEILALSQDDAPEPVHQFMAKEGYHFPVAMAEQVHLQSVRFATQVCRGNWAWVKHIRL